MRLNEQVDVRRKEKEKVLTFKFVTCMVDGGGSSLQSKDEFTHQTAKMLHQVTLALVFPSVK